MQGGSFRGFVRLGVFRVLGVGFVAVAMLIVQAKRAKGGDFATGDDFERIFHFFRIGGIDGTPAGADFQGFVERRLRGRKISDERVESARAERARRKG